MLKIRERLEKHQIMIYFVAIILATTVALVIPGTTALEVCINPSLALMLFLTFLQVPLTDLKQSFSQIHFLKALFIVNFIVIPILVAILFQFLPVNPIIRLGVLLVLLTPCIDYVVTFTHLGQANARLLLVATPSLLIMQMILLPVYLRLFLGEETEHLVKIGPFIHAFIWLIAIPLILAVLLQLGTAQSRKGQQILTIFGMLTVPATALVLFVVIASVVPELSPSINAALSVIPIYIIYAMVAPLLGWFVARWFKLDSPTGRAIAFSASTRNSLVVLPLAYAVPNAIPILPAVIVTQTLVELISELIYIRLIPKFMTTSIDNPITIK